LNSENEIIEWIYINNHNRTVQEILYESVRLINEFIDAFEKLSEEILANKSSLPWMNGQPLSAEIFFSHFHEEGCALLKYILAQPCAEADLAFGLEVSLASF
jgi:hypothetical protein